MEAEDTQTRRETRNETDTLFRRANNKGDPVSDRPVIRPLPVIFTYTTPCRRGAWKIALKNVHQSRVRGLGRLPIRNRNILHR